MKRWRWAAVVMAVGTLAWWMWPRGAPRSAPAGLAEPDILTKGVWVDRDPREMKDTDFVHAIAFVNESDYGRVGAVLKASHHDFHLRTYNWHVKAGRGELIYRQDGGVKRFRYVIEECAELPPATHCLTFDNSPFGGPRKFYGPTDPDVWVPGKAFGEPLRRGLRALAKP